MANIRYGKLSFRLKAGNFDRHILKIGGGIFFMIFKETFIASLRLLTKVISAFKGYLWADTKG